MSFTSTMGRSRGRLAFGSVAIAALLLGQMTALSQAADGPDIFVIGGKADDPFWSKVKRGADDAGLVVAAGGGSVTWLGPQNYDNLGPDAAKLVLNAISQNADGVIGPDWVPEAEDEAFMQVVAAGIPLVIYNAGGMDAATRVGALNYIGTDEYPAGLAGGEAFAADGRTNVLCINTFPGASFSEARCQGIADGIAISGGTSSQLPLPSSNYGNPTAVAQAVKAALLQDSSIDAVVTLGTLDANSVASALEQADAVGRVALGTFDMDLPSLERIQAGTQLFAIDQQPYLQGYLAVSLLNSHILYGLDFPDKPTATGPAVIDASNVESVLRGVEAGVR